MKKHGARTIAILVIVVVVAIIGLSGIYRVNQGEQAVVLTFGEKTDVREAGMYWHVPFVQSVAKQSRTQLYTLEYGFRTQKAATTSDTAEYSDEDKEAIMLTKDQNIVKVEAVYKVYVEDVAAFLYQVNDPFDTMQRAFETVIRRNLQNRTLDDALLNKQQIESEVLPEFRDMLNSYDIGVKVKEVLIQNINVPAEVLSAYQDVNNAMAEKTTKLDEAEKYKNQVVPNARAQAYKLVQDAEAYRAKTVANAEGEVAQFNDVYAKYVNNKDITRKRLLIETLEKILSSAGKLYMVDDSSGLLKMLNIGEDTGSAAPTTPAATAPAQGGK